MAKPSTKWVFPIGNNASVAADRDLDALAGATVHLRHGALTAETLFTTEPRQSSYDCIPKPLAYQACRDGTANT
ncbi:hypothetical protein Poly24_46800 [Rosistilla carotiformis]|uniref:Uncharacterized protein n=1 Tax=Rosistilla carotiformis TaxID=2528017 RepID=A0A518JZG8_9BACT|nr:hypothetical protein Poly24_46800 [Rosistilla carotiformis]